MNALNRLVNEVVSISNPSDKETGFGVVRSVDRHKNTACVDLWELESNIEVDATRLMVQPHLEEALQKLRSIINDFYSRLDNCPDKECTVCPRHRNKYNEALNLIELLKIL